MSHVRAASPTVPSPWIRRFHAADGAPARLACFAHAGGSASSFFALSAVLSPRLDVLAVQYPGRHDRLGEPFVDDVHELADRIVGELEAWCDRPLGLFGHSLGASVAFEVGVRLRERGCEPAVLFASGRRAPSRRRDDDELLHRADDERLVASLAAMDGTAAEALASRQLLRMVLPAVRADYRAAECYRHRPGDALSCPIVVLTGSDDAQVTDEEAVAWGEHTSGASTVHRFAGGHFFADAHDAAICALVLRALARQP